MDIFLHVPVFIRCVALSKQEGILLIFTHTVHATFLLKASRGKIP
jgi:hypothetical protein